MPMLVRDHYVENQIKAERAVTSADAAKGVTAHVVVMMTWNGFDQKFKHPQSGTAAAHLRKLSGFCVR